MNPKATHGDVSRQPAETAPVRLARELSTFEAEERARLGLRPSERAQWHEVRYDRFALEERGRTTILLFGLTRNHDELVGAALRSLGHRVQVLDVPDDESHTLGRAFCDRGMCNPTYYTVGRLLHFLFKLRDEEKLSPREIVKRYALVTPNGCGPCRFTLYINEYRKALRDAGFEGFRVLLFNQSLIERQSGPDAGLQIDGRLLFKVVRAVIIGDILNLHAWRTRPYEVEPGATNAAIARCRARLMETLERKEGLFSALWQVRRQIASIAVDRTRVKPKVSIIGEFWAHTTEGDGNYRLQEFLEGEGAEVEPQSLIAWILFLQWEAIYDTVWRAGLRDPLHPARTVSPRGAWLKASVVHVLVALMRLHVRAFAWLAGLRGFKLPRTARLARAAQPFYDVTQRGGEEFLEVAKLLHMAEHGGAHMVVSVKPFGCMPSSAVSDGVQSLVSARHPQVEFLPIETTGDSAVNAYGRLQMQLFKARRLAQREADLALAAGRIGLDEVRAYLQRHPAMLSALHRSRHRCACTAANLYHHVTRRPRFLLLRAWRILRDRAGRWSARRGPERPRPRAGAPGGAYPRQSG